MIEFQNIECDLKIKKQEFSFWLNEIIIEENKILGDIVYVFCDDNYLLAKNIKYLNHNTLTDVITFDYSKNKLISGDILTRLLEAENAAREQDEENSRKSTEWGFIPDNTTEQYFEYIKQKKAQEELLKTTPAQLKPYYKKKVNNYLNTLIKEK